MLNYQRVGDGGDGSVFFGSARVDKVPLKYEKMRQSWAKVGVCHVFMVDLSK